MYAGIILRKDLIKILNTAYICVLELDFRNEFFDIFMSLLGKCCLGDIVRKVAKT